MNLLSYQIYTINLLSYHLYNINLLSYHIYNINLLNYHILHQVFLLISLSFTKLQTASKNIRVFMQISLNLYVTMLNIITRISGVHVQEMLIN